MAAICDTVEHIKPLHVHNYGLYGLHIHTDPLPVWFACDSFDQFLLLFISLLFTVQLIPSVRATNYCACIYTHVPLIYM